VACSRVKKLAQRATDICKIMLKCWTSAYDDVNEILADMARFGNSENHVVILRYMVREVDHVFMFIFGA